jgi:hypothetical protein
VDLRDVALHMARQKRNTHIPPAAGVLSTTGELFEAVSLMPECNKCYASGWRGRNVIVIKLTPRQCSS